MTLNSINTNTAALVALQSLNDTNSQLATVQNRVSTGFKVANAQDDSAAFAIAQGLRGNVQGYSAIQEQLSKAQGNMSVANTAAQSISDELANVRATVTKLADANTTGTAQAQYINDYNNEIAEISRYISGANFNGTNLLNTTTGVNVITGLNGSTLTLRATNLTVDVVGKLTPITSSADAIALIGPAGGLTTAETNIGNTMANLGDDTKSLTDQIAYVGTLSDATTEGIGDIVDADMAKESANLQALQVRQQLATQTLSIANQSPNILLGLFKQ